ncbi:ABC transporter permease ['Paenibacillus yunnanensis' Narsing Rao et al. 2020]|uniref:ABC transporter permease n=1 Tax=Paenibacillus tengchongensis TaxID=2608684 RepID=UPI00124F7336|nr:ABC transporter permease [Paenibacillus tengchongensis]
MNNIWTIAVNELRMLFRSRTVILNTFLLPLVLIFLLGTALSGVVGVKSDESIDPVRVAMVYEGGQAGNAAMVADFVQSPELTDYIIPSEASSREEAENGLRSGKYGYAVIVPQDFDKNVQSGQDAQLEYILGKKRMDNTVAGTVFDNFLGSINYRQSAVQVLGPQAAAAALAEPARQETAVKLGDLNNGGRNYTASQYYAASMLLMFLLYSGLDVSGSLFGEKDRHTLYRISSMPVTGRELFTGKMLGVGIVTALQCATIIILSNLLFGVYWGNRPWLLALFCLLMILISMTFSVIVSMFCKTHTTANTVVNFVTVGMTFLSGGMTPLPDAWINSVGSFTFNHWALDSMIRMMLHSGLSQLLPNLWVLSLIALGLLGAAILSYRKVGYHA